MTIFWDTSAVINALVSPPVYDRLKSGHHTARVHMIAEFFSIMTGRGIKAIDAISQHEVQIIMSADDAVQWLNAFCAKIEWVDLEGSETIQALDSAQSLGIQGGRVYDYLHAEAAKKANAGKLLTRNAKHFRNLTGKITLEWP
jgi:hypothetical protein